MRKKRIRLRALPLVLSVSMVMSTLSPSVCLAADGYTEFEWPNFNNLRDYSFGDYAQTLSYKYGITPTGLALNFTSTHRKVASHLDVLEAFPDADGQLGKTSLEEESNWQNNESSQFMKWDGWDYSEEGNPAKTR